MRDRTSLYRETADGDIENVYNLRIMNKTEQPQHVRLSVSGPDGIRLDARQATTFEVPAGEAYGVAVRVQAPPASHPGGRPINFHLDLTDRSGVAINERSRFIAP